MRRAVQQRRLALLALIAASPGQSISRDRLLGLLWPERDERSARHLLADSLYVLRRALGDDAIVASGESLRLSPELVWNDVVEFRTALAEERWSDALQLYRGDFLEGFFVRNAVEFDLWAKASSLAFALSPREPRRRWAISFSAPVGFTKRPPRRNGRSSCRRATNRRFAISSGC
jgi:DNA-binding SARP family transcriptional activator